MKSLTDHLFSKLLTYLFLILSVFVLFYVFYRSEILYAGKEFDHYLKYYIISGAGIVFWIIVLFLEKNVRQNIILVTLAFIVCLYGVELFMKISKLANKNEFYVAAKRAGIDFDLRTKFEVYGDLKKSKKNVFPVVHSNMFLNDTNKVYPIGGASKSTTIHCNESGNYSIYLSDRYGFNNPDNEWDSQEVEWLLTGDSFAHGACVNSSEDIAGQIRAMTGENVINLGNRGNGPLVELASLVEYAKFKKPSKVLWTYYEGNDLKNLHDEKYSIFLNYLESDYLQHLIEKQTEIDNIIKEKINTIVSTAHNPILLKTSFFRLYETRLFVQKKFTDVCSKKTKSKVYFFCEEKDKRDYFNNIDLFMEIILKAQNLTSSWDGKLYFVYLPQYERYAFKTKDHNSYQKREQIINLVKKLNIPVIDIHKEFFSQVEDPLSYFPFRLKGHYTKEGYKAVASALIK